MKLLRITTVPISLDLLLTDQMAFMKNNGIEVIMVSANGPQIEKVVEREGCKHMVIPFTRQITPVRDLSCLIKMIRLIQREKPDIIHTHTPKAGLIGMLAAKFTGVKLKVHTVAGLPLMTAGGFKKKLLVVMERLTTWAADFILPNSQSLLQFIKDQKLAPEKKLDIIGNGSTNGIDVSTFSHDGFDKLIMERVKASIAYHPDHKYLLSVGRIVKDKGIVELVKAFQQLKSKHENLRLILLGPLEEIRSEELLPSATLSLIKQDPHIVHINWTDHVKYYMALADVFVQASHREGFPNVTLQAGAMCCPIVCSKIPGNIDIVTDLKTGVHFKTGDVDDLLAKILLVLNDHIDIKRMSQTLRKEIETYFDRAKVHKQILAFYKSQLAIVHSHK